MRNRKPIADLFDDSQLRTMDAVLDRVVTVMIDMGTVNDAAHDCYRRYVAGVIVKVARQGLYDEDELTQRVLEALIRPPANNDPVPQAGGTGVSARKPPRRVRAEPPRTV